MTLQTMYPALVNSPFTELASAIDHEQTTIEVLDGSKLPDAPNIATIGTGEDAETILYAQKDGNVLSEVTRGFQATAKAWGQGTSVARMFTAYDYDTLRINLQNTKQELDDTKEELGEHKAETAKDRNTPTVIEKMINGDPVSIVCYGDSMTYGYVPGSGEKTANPYPETLQSILREYYNNANISVYNEGIPGIQSDELSQEGYIANVTAHNPDLTILMVGINDNNGSSFGSIVPIEQFRKNIIKIIESINSKFLLMTPTPYNSTSGDGAVINSDRINEYVKAVQNVAEQYNTGYINTFNVVDNDLRFRNYSWTEIFGDNVHFNDDYYQRFAQFVFAHGLCNDNIVIDDETNINTYDSLWRLGSGVSHFISANNPQFRNIIIASGQSVKISILINKPSAKIYFLCPTGTSTSLTDYTSSQVVVDDEVVEMVPLNSNFSKAVIGPNNMVFWDEKFYVGEYSYGLHTIEVNNIGTDANSMIFINSLLVEPQNFTKEYGSPINSTNTTKEKILSQDEIKLTVGSMGPTFEFVGNFGHAAIGTKLRITLNAENEIMGFCLGSHFVFVDGKIQKIPKYAIYRLNANELQSSMFAMGGTVETPTFRYYHLLKKGTEVYELNTDSYVTIEFTETGIEFYVNDVLSVSYTYDEMLIGDLDLWIYGFTENGVVKIKKVEKLIS